LLLALRRRRARVSPHQPASSGFSVQKFGVTMFETGMNEVPIEDWGLDDLVLRYQFDSCLRPKGVANNPTL
jgi:hypothetical protein